MINFNSWKCRNCGHWHDYDIIRHEPVALCRQQKEYSPEYCYCNDFESSDNLIYLEQIYSNKVNNK